MPPTHEVTITKDNPDEWPEQKPLVPVYPVYLPDDNLQLTLKQAVSGAATWLQASYWDGAPPGGTIWGQLRAKDSPDVLATYRHTVFIVRSSDVISAQELPACLGEQPLRAVFEAARAAALRLDGERTYWLLCAAEVVEVQTLGNDALTGAVAKMLFAGHIGSSL